MQRVSHIRERCLVFQLEDSFFLLSVRVLFDLNWQPTFWNTKISREIHVWWIVEPYISNRKYYLYGILSGIYRPSMFRNDKKFSIAS